jgi:hypothetical protein
VKTPPAQPEAPLVSDCRQVRLTQERRLRTRVAGIFLFLPLLTQLRLDHLVRQAGYPGSRMVPAVSALLSLLALKLLDKERHSHINDFNFDEALGLFAGLNVLPKKSYATDYSYRTQRCHQRQLLAGWIAALAPLLFPQGHTFALDFHPIPYRGDPTGLENHFVSARGKACPSVQSFFAQEHDSGVLCYANANLARSDQAGEVMRFVEFWHEVTGQDPSWLYFDSKVAPYAELNRLNQRDIRFITIRRRGVAVIARLRRLPASAWQRAVIDIPKRRHQHVRFVEETIRLSEYDEGIRQVALDGLGREQPTLLLSNDFAETARSLVVRYAGRNRVEDGLGQSVNFFHLDCLASEVPLNVDLDVALTVLANGCYRWLGRQLRGFDKAAAKQIYRKFVETAGVVEIRREGIVVHFDKRAHNPILREAALDRNSPPVPWLQGRPLRFEFT